MAKPPGKTFLRAEMLLGGKGFGVPIFKQNLSLNVGIKCLGLFLLLFLADVCGVPKRFHMGLGGAGASFQVWLSKSCFKSFRKS